MRATLQKRYKSLLFATGRTYPIPVKRLVFLLTLYQNLPKHFTKEVVVGLFFELESLHILEISVENEIVFSERLNKIVYLRHLFETPDFCVFLSLGVDLNSLPGQFAYQKVQQ